MNATTMDMRRRAFLGSAVAVFGGIGRAADADAQGTTADWQQTVDAANREGTVVMYAAKTPIVLQRVTDGFRKLYPKITLQVVRDIEGVLIPKIEQEQKIRAPGADVYVGSTYDFFDDQIAAGTLAKPRGPNATLFPPASFYRGFSPPMQILPMGIAYNTDMVKTPPTTLEDLLRPEFKDSLGTINSNASSAVTAWYDDLRKQDPDFWTKLAAQQPRFFPSTIPMTQAVASGEISATIFTQPAIVTGLVMQGAPIKFVVPTGRTVFCIEDLIAILTTAQHPNAAQVFVDYMLSKDGQAAINSDGLGMSAMPGVPGALPQVPVEPYNPKLYPADAIRRINAEWAAVFKK